MDLAARTRAWEELAARDFDVLVVGGGIIGAGIACEASRAGMAVALVDRADFGSQTTSASSKLVHGGLRYLRLGDVGLVREAHEERRTLMRLVAPHLVRRLPFLLPLYEDGPYGRLVIRSGLWVYGKLARERFQTFVEPARARRSVPPLRLDGLRGCGVFADAWTHDTRLCLANVRAATDRGATVANYAELVALRLHGGRAVGGEVRDVLSGEVVSVRARAVVNATGPWVDRVRRLEDAGARPSSRLSKGVHVLVPLEEAWSAALLIPHDKVRVSFAVPWEGMLLLGTTDTLYEGDPADARVTDDDVATVLAEAGVGVASNVVRPEAVRASFAGLRVLPDKRRDAARARRETLYLGGRAGMLSIAGGKLTTYRRIALGALARLRVDLGLHRVDLPPAPLPGAVDPTREAARLARTHPALEARTRSHLAHLYGGLASEVLARAGDDEALLAALHPDAPDIGAQVVYAREREWAVTADDVLRRRTTLAFRGLMTPDVVARVESLVAPSAPSRG